MLMNQLISVNELMNLYLYYNSNQKTSLEYTLKLQNQYKTTFFFPTVIYLKRPAILNPKGYILSKHFFYVKFQLKISTKCAARWRMARRRERRMSNAAKMINSSAVRATAQPAQQR